MTFFDSGGSLFIDPEELTQGYKGWFQLLFLFFVYVYVLMIGCNLIGDGSELLEATKYQKLIGPTILPVLGAVPDAAIVFFSGLGNDAQSQIGTGMGALAGSTVMLLTVPWVLCVYGGRVDLIDGKAAYSDSTDANVPGTLTDPDSWGWTDTGIEVESAGSPIALSGVWMMITALPYFIIEFPAFRYMDADDEALADHEKDYALAGFIMCSILAIGYLTAQYLSTLEENTESEDNMELVSSGHVRATLIQKGYPLSRLLKEMIAADQGNSNNQEYDALMADSDKEHRMNRLIVALQPTFNQYAQYAHEPPDNILFLDPADLNIVFFELGLKKTSKEIREIFEKFDTNHDERLDIKEFACFVDEYLTHQEGSEGEGSLISEAMQKLLLGGMLVLLFSDPLVDVLDEMGTKTGIPDFYLGFIIAPFITNGSELIASYRFAEKKTKESITCSLQQLYGAACMNNTLSLGVFLLLVWMEDLYWDYNAESLCVVGFELLMFYYAFQTTHTVLSAFVVLSFYPLSLVFIMILEYGFGFS